MSRRKVLSAAEIRAELAFRRITMTELAVALGVSFSYIEKILSGRRDAPAQRARITEHLGELEFRRTA